MLSALSKGNAINNFLEQITFQVLPMLIDLGSAIFYFGVVFDAYYALVVTTITFSYLRLTVRVAREEEAVKNDSLTSYETVKYFNAGITSSNTICSSTINKLFDSQHVLDISGLTASKVSPDGKIPDRDVGSKVIC